MAAAGNAGVPAGNQSPEQPKKMAKNMGYSIIGAALCHMVLAAHPGGLYDNEREFTNLTLGAWRVRLQACRPAGGMEVFSGDHPVGRLGEAGAEFPFPTQEGVEIRYRSLDDIRFTLVDHRGNDGGVVFQVGRRLELIPLGGDPADLEAVVDPVRLRGGHVDLLLGEWPVR